MSRKVTFKGNVPDANSSGFADYENTSDPSNAPAYRFEINLLELARIIMGRRRMVIGVTLGVMMAVSLYLFIQPNLYTSTATILPSGKGKGLSDLTSLVGLGDPLAHPDENSSILFPVVLRSNLIIDAVSDRIYSFSHQGQTRTLTVSDYFGIDNRDRLRKALKDITTIRSDNQTGEIYVGVETRYPALSRAILKNYLDRLEDFNRHKRRSSARDNEAYLSRQLGDIKRELQAAEDSLEAFQMANLDWAISGSPEILKELGRRQRDVQAKSATYGLLTQQYEMAKLEAQKDIPIVRILDEPSMPVMKSGPFRRNIIILSGVLSFMFMVMFLIIRHLIGQVVASGNREDYEALRDDLERAFPRTRATLNRLRTSVLEKTPFIKS